MALTIERELVTVSEAAVKLCVHRSTVRRWIDSGRLAAVRTGQGQIRIDQAEIDALIVTDINSDATLAGSTGTRYAMSAVEVFRPRPVDSYLRGLRALEATRELREELLEQRGGELFPPAFELVRDSRDHWPEHHS